MMDETDETGIQTPFARSIQDTMPPIVNRDQLGQLLLKVYAKLSDPDQIKVQKIEYNSAIIEKQTVLNEYGEQVEVGVLKGFKKKVIEVPVRIPPKYRELITGDIATAFLSYDDYDLYLDNGNYCQTVKSFADRYDLDLSLHHNHYVGMTNQMVVGSGAVEGQRPTLAKTDIAKTISRADSVQTLQQKAEKNRSGFLEKLAKGI